MSLYYDRQGQPITLDQWAERVEASRHVARDDVVTPHGRCLWVSTVWLGLDMNLGLGDVPLIFETMAFEGHNPLVCQRYTTEAQALAGHAEVVHAAHEGLLDPRADVTA